MATDARDGSVDMSDFFLHEAQAQLQLALFGAQEGWMEENNAKKLQNAEGDQTVPLMAWLPAEEGGERPSKEEGTGALRR